MFLLVVPLVSLIHVEVRIAKTARLVLPPPSTTLKSLMRALHTHLLVHRALLPHNPLIEHRGQRALLLLNNEGGSGRPG